MARPTRAAGLRRDLPINPTGRPSNQGRPTISTAVRPRDAAHTREGGAHGTISDGTVRRDRGANSQCHRPGGDNQAVFRSTATCRELIEPAAFDGNHQLPPVQAARLYGRLLALSRPEG